MISFKGISQKNKDEVLSQVCKGLSESEKELFVEIADSLDTDDDADVEFAISQYSGCALVRVFDMGRYLFLFPYELSDKADITCAIKAVGEYAMREEIPLVFSDVPLAEMGAFSGYRHMDIDAEDPNAEAFRVKINTECTLCENIPEVTDGRVKLNALSEEDIAVYARLCKDENVNKCWGYDYRADNKNPRDRYFYENAQSEFSRGISISMAVRCDGEFVGEAVLYAFDGKGCSEFAIRLLPESQGLGIGNAAISLLKKAALKIGLVSLRAKVLRENFKSISMMNKNADVISEDEDSVTYEFPLI